ncbi:MAG: acyltransferase family protein [Leptolyngbyaceae cyanobacterium]
MKLWRLEAFRGLAALYIVISHVLGNDYFFLRFGQEAVMVFFMMSGFVIEYSFQKSRYKNFSNYFLKRFLRIYPVLILMFIVVALIQQPNFQSPKFLKHVLGNLLMLQDFRSGKPNVVVPALFSSALWSLHYQWWHYMFYYPINQLLQRRHQAIVVGSVGVVATLLYFAHPNFVFRLWIYFPIWWVGVEMARSFLQYKRVRAQDLKISIIALLIIAGLLIADTTLFIAQGNAYSFGIHPFLETRHFAAAIAAIIASLAWQRWHWIGFEYLKFGVALAPISYSLYIAHQPLLANSHYLGFIQNPWLEQCLYLVILLLFCYGAEIKLTTFLRSKLEQPSFRALKAKVFSK